MSNRYLSTLFKSGEEFEEFLNKLDAFKKGIEKGTIIIPEATKATQDGDGNDIGNTYVKKTDLANGNTTAYKAERDGNGNIITSTYAKKTDLTNGTVTVKKATQDANGNNIADTYLAKSALDKITAKPTEKTYTLLPKTGYYYIELHDTTNAGHVVPLGVMYWSSGTEIRKQFDYYDKAYTFIILVGGGTSLKNADNTSASSKFSIYINSWQ